VKNALLCNVEESYKNSPIQIQLRMTPTFNQFVFVFKNT